MIYFDNAATTVVDDEVLNSFLNTLKMFPGNSSSIHLEGLKAAKLEKKARLQVANFFNAQEEEVIFTSGATESNNLALKGTALRYKNRGKHIITTKIEHASVLETCRQLEELYGFEVTYLNVNDKGTISLDELEKNIRDDTILVSIMAVNNEVGSIQPIEEVAKMLKKYPKIHFHVDATQAIGKININYNDVDLIALSGHKINSFKAFGILIKRKTTDLVPLITGGGHQFGYRSGTTNVPGEVAIAKAIRLAFENRDQHYKKVLELRNYFVNKLMKIDGIQLNSTEECSPFIVSFAVPKKASVVAEALSNKEIYVSTKSACSSKKESISYVLEAMNKDAWIIANSLRVSFAYYNTIEEVDKFITTLEQVLTSIK